MIHVDDVEVYEGSSGELQSRRRRLGAAAGATRIGVSRWEIAPGMRSTPVHVHADEEEIFFVLGGSGLSYQDGKAFHVGPGDVIVHRVNAEAHTLLAGDDGLDVLAFAEGSDTGITYLPRCGVFWLGPRWVPADGPHPFKAELAAGPLERPAPSPERPATILHVDEAQWETYAQAGYEGRETSVARQAGATRTGLRKTVLEPGSLSCPPHYHLGEEEAFYVLEGSGLFWVGDERIEARPGSFMVRPLADRVAHAIEAGPEGITYLAYGHNVAQDVVFYPRSNKVNISGLMYRVEPVDYFDGEQPAKP